MILRLRRWSRAVSVVLVLAAVPGLSHLAEDDVACLSAVDAYGQHDQTQQALRSAGTASHQDHCAICHWTRSLRAPRATLAAWARHAPISFPVHCAPAAPHVAPVLDQTPARAPPAVLP